MPSQQELAIDPKAAYVHITSNETIQGCSSKPILNRLLPSFATLRQIPISSFRCFQIRNDLRLCPEERWPSGVTVVIVRKELIERSKEDLPGYLSYKNHSTEGSMWNTPPTFAIYTLGLVCQWLEETIGSLEKMLKINQEKAALVYSIVDKYPELYIGHAQKASRSLMNVTFKFKEEETEKAFLKGAEALGLDSLKGHRSVGGIRASIYNAMPLAGAHTLADYMNDFAIKHS